MYQVIARYLIWNCPFENLGLFIDKAAANAFCKEEQNRLGPDYEVKVQKYF